MNILNFNLGEHPKVIETGLGFIIMGQYYTKSNLDPVTLEGYSIQGGDNILNLHNTVFLADNAREGLRDRMFKITKDTFIEDRYYFMVNGHYSDVNSTTPYLCISEEKDEQITILASVSAENREWYQIVDQDGDYIYVTWKDLSGHICGMSRIDKETFEETEIFNQTSTTRAVPDFMFKDDVYIYISVRLVNATIALFRYNKSEQTYLTKTKNAAQDVAFYSVSPAVQGGTAYRNYITPITNEKLFPQNCIIRHDDCYIDGLTRSIVIPQRYNDKMFLSNGMRDTNSTGLESEEYTNNTFNWVWSSGNTWTVNTTASNRNHGSFILNTATAFENNNFYYALGSNYRKPEFTRLTHEANYNTYRYWIIDNTHLCLMMYEESNTKAGHITYQGLLVCTIQNTTNLTITKLDRITTAKEIVTMCYTTDKKTLIIGFKNEFLLYKWNGTQYVTTGITVTDVVSAGFDELDRLWYQKSDGSVHVVNMTDPHTVTTTFEKAYYMYSGTNIPTYITFSAKDFLGNTANGVYELELIGDAVFEETNTKIYKFEFTENECQINIIIKGSKAITCKTTFVSS